MDKKKGLIKKSFKMSRFKIRWLLRFYVPLLGAGIRISHVSKNFHSLDAAMPMRWYNKNLFGTHFGGSLFSMCDPFIVLMLLQILDDDYIIWDKSSSIEFIRPGKGTVTAKFRITDTDIQDIVTHTETGESYNPKFEIIVTDEINNIVALVEKTIYVRKKVESPAKESSIKVNETQSNSLLNPNS